MQSSSVDGLGASPIIATCLAEKLRVQLRGQLRGQPSGGSIPVAASWQMYRDFFRMSQLLGRFLMISFGCLSSRAHFLGFPSNVSDC